jgi:hypothetical protein
LGSFAKGGTVRVSQMLDIANLSIYGPVEENTIGDILTFLPAESIGTWEILNVPNNPSGNGFNSLKQTIDNLNLGLDQKSKEEVDIKPIQRVDNTPSFYKGRSGD